MIPTVGRIVHYRLTRADAQAANRRHADAERHRSEHREAATGVQVHVGNHHAAGDVVPLLVVRVWVDEYQHGATVCRDSMPGDEYATLDFFTPESPYGVNGQAFLDGNDTLWVTSAPQGNRNGCWSWPDRA